ncbi:low molecular weight protein arginine phosphatase [Paenibacillus woosongensis]|uniref:Low molecular weight protein arginine phosphatase n=1 Tax=Paenibacillus woosongensis TaxID=307580 RepID=A0A7X3CNY1_9BACL|nr:low molecular weight protein arginine phosphatase [Paenibacillus woosongensis]MUG46780.1 low molecular weight protein arginine phosphatase [Paenibacillus woosongensis]
MRILFVCTGNTCRSPMAEGIFRKLARERGIDAEVASAGVAAVAGLPISRHAEGVLKDQGIHDQITSTPLHAELIEWADLILTLTGGHKQQAIAAFPEKADKIYTLKEYVEDDEVVLAEQAELNQLIADLELSRALGQALEEAKEQRIRELLQRMPRYDISDPFGGSREDYNLTAQEISAALEKLIAKLERERLR